MSFATPSRRVADKVDPFHPPGGLLHFRATILWSIVPEVVFFSAIATAVSLISVHVRPLHVASTLLTVFGTVLGFIVSYRTSSAYEKYSEGRRLWSAVILASRSMARMTWHHVPNYIHPPANPGDPVDEAEAVRALVEKKTMINLIGAFGVALKHYLRGEGSIYYKDLYPMISFLPRYRLPTSNAIARPDLDPTYRMASSPEPSESTHDFSTQSSSNLIGSLPMNRNQGTSSTIKTHNSSHGLTPRRLIAPRPLLPSRNPPPRAVSDWLPFWALLMDCYEFVCHRARKVQQKRRKGSNRRRIPLALQKEGDNIPLELTLLMSGWVAALQRRKSNDVPTTNSLLAAIQSFSDSLTGLERILLSPIPVAYSIHLRHCIWLYLFFLPCQTHAKLGYITIPSTAIATFVFLGFIAIGQEIESPFGYDDADLDLDSFNQTILKELAEITAHDPTEADPANFCFVDSNLPFAVGPLYEGLSATQIVEGGIPLEELKASLGPERPEIFAELRRSVSLRGKEGV